MTDKKTGRQIATAKAIAKFQTKKIEEGAERINTYVPTDIQHALTEYAELHNLYHLRGRKAGLPNTIGACWDIVREHFNLPKP
jgi:hypothetical protein